MLELQDICFRIQEDGRKKTILNHVSLEIKSGAFTVITGPNGSGKSTLAQLIMGIKLPTSGRIIFNKNDITSQDITARADQGIAFSFQQPVKFKGLTVYDILNIASGTLISKEEAGQYLQKVGLTPADYLSREIGPGLSGGELKRIEIASVLARNAQLIIFDEPEAGIDLWSFDHLIKVFKKLHQAGHTIIVISHQERILKIADEIIILEAGKIKQRGTPAKIMPQLTEAQPWI